MSTKPCTKHGCPLIVDTNAPHPDCPLELDARCPSNTHAQRRRSDAQRPTAARRGYNARWRRTAALYLRDHPTCECDECMLRPEALRPAATDVDHIDGRGPNGPHGHDPTNLQAMTHAHHLRKTAREEGGGWSQSRNSRSR